MLNAQCSMKGNIMALRNPNTATAPAFESEDTVDQPQPHAAPEVADISKSTELAPAPVNTGVAVSPAANSKSFFKSIKDAISPDDLKNMGMNSFKKVTIGLDGFSIGEKELGKKIAIDSVSWSHIWFVTTGEQSSPETNKAVRTSYDGVNLDNGENTVEGYLEFLKSEGYEKAKKKQYIELFGDLIWTEKDGDIDPEDQELVKISLSPQSCDAWTFHMLQSGRRAVKGIPENPVVTLTQEKRTFGSNKFGVASFQAGLKK